MGRKKSEKYFISLINIDVCECPMWCKKASDGSESIILDELFSDFTD